MNARKWAVARVSARLGLATLLAFAMLAATVAGIALAYGNPDDAFGTNGLVTTDFGGEEHDVARAMALQPDGRIIAAGYTHNGQNDDFAVARYNTDGSLDTTFGSGGIVTTTFGDSDEWAYGVAIQPDGRIVVAGTARVSDTLWGVYDLALARYNSDGTLDPTFGGGDGQVTTDNGGGWNDFGYAVVLQSDKIVVVGATLNLAGTRIAVARYNSDGSLDGTFNGSGLATAHDDCEARAVALQPNNWIVVAGMCIEDGSRDFGLARFDADGYPDTTFGENGLALTDIDVDDMAFAVAIQPDGQIVVGGDSGDWDGGCGSPQDLALARYSGSDGSLDTTFGVSGVVTTDLGLMDVGLCNGEERGYALALQPDGRIVVGGSTGVGSMTPGGAEDFILARYNDNGSLDRTFGDDGWMMSPVSNTFPTAVYAVALQPDGKVVAAGWLSGNRALDFLVFRYQNFDRHVYLPLARRGQAAARAMRQPQAVISPTSSFILYSRADDTTIWLEDESGHAWFMDGIRPRLSPAGRYIVYQDEGIWGDLYVRDLQTSLDTRIFTATQHLLVPEWTPDGNRIVFDHGCHIYAIGRDGSNLETLIDTWPGVYYCSNDSPDVNPIDGRLAWENEHVGLGVAEADGSNPGWVTNTQPYDYSPRWSPDGQWIAFWRDNDLFRIRPDGTGLTQMTFVPADNWMEDTGQWTPDGRYLVAAARLNGAEGLYTVATDGSGALVLLIPRDWYAPDWVGSVGNVEIYRVYLPLVVRGGP